MTWPGPQRLRKPAWVYRGAEVHGTVAITPATARLAPVYGQRRNHESGTCWDMMVRAFHHDTHDTQVNDTHQPALVEMSGVPVVSERGTQQFHSRQSRRAE